MTAPNSHLAFDLISVKEVDEDFEATNVTDG